jgi:benzaldehyde dehydrogenase (NAD)
MNAPIPRILIESMWRGRLFGTQWRPAIGGSLDVLEPATGAVITRVGNATAEDVRQAAAEARAAQPGWAATPDERAAILRKVAGLMADNQAELSIDHARPAASSRSRLRGADGDEHPAPRGRNVHGAAGPDAAERRRAAVAGAARAARVIGVISPFNFPLILSSRAVAPRSPPATRSCSSLIRAPRSLAASSSRGCSRRRAA